MILSHQLRLIFLKTRKTAGTSVELALSPFCGPDDVLPPLGQVDEAKREGHGARNWLVPPERRSWLAPLWLKLGWNENDAGYTFYSHMPANEVRRLVPKPVFDGYLKVAIERNPWDRELSYYYWLNRRPERRQPFEAFVAEHTLKKPLNNFGIYAIGGGVVADLVLKYEELESGFTRLAERLGLDPIPTLGHAKAGRRPEETRNYRAMYTPETRDAVAKVYRREIEAFGYEF
jgi:hypothetical protein